MINLETLKRPFRTIGQFIRTEFQRMEWEIDLMQTKRYLGDEGVVLSCIQKLEEVDDLSKGSQDHILGVARYHLRKLRIGREMTRNEVVNRLEACSDDILSPTGRAVIRDFEQQLMEERMGSLHATSRS